MTEEANTDTSTGQDGKSDRMVPLAALTAETAKRQTLQTEVAELRGRVDGMATASRPPAQEPKPWTRATLKQAVTDEKISEDEADALMDKQTEDRLVEKIGAELSARIDSNNLGQKVSSEIDRYKGAVKDLDDKESPAYLRVAKEFNALVEKYGYDRKDLRTEAAALRSAFGDIETLTKDSISGERQTFEETGGGSGGPGGDKEGVAGYPKGTSVAQRVFYDDLIAKGMHTKASAIEEMTYKPKTVSRGKAA